MYTSPTTLLLLAASLLALTNSSLLPRKGKSPCICLATGSWCDGRTSSGQLGGNCAKDTVFDCSDPANIGKPPANSQTCFVEDIEAEQEAEEAFEAGIVDVGRRGRAVKRDSTDLRTPCAQDVKTDDFRTIFGGSDDCPSS